MISPSVGIRHIINRPLLLYYWMCILIIITDNCSGPLLADKYQILLSPPSPHLKGESKLLILEEAIAQNVQGWYTTKIIFVRTKEIFFSLKGNCPFRPLNHYWRSNRSHQPMAPPLPVSSPTFSIHVLLLNSYWRSSKYAHNYIIILYNNISWD